MSNDDIARFFSAVDKVTAQLEARCNALSQQIASSSHPVFSSTSLVHAFEIKTLSDNLVKELSTHPGLAPLLADDTVNDILINGHQNVYVERSNQLEKTGVTFSSDAEVLAIADKIAKSMGRMIDVGRPMVDARLPDGSRVNIIAPPLAVDGTVISIRKFNNRKLTLDVMKKQGNMSENLAEFLKICAKCKVNMLISGGTGAGKTTLLNALSQYIKDTDRIITIEDAAELQLRQPHVIRLETKAYHPNSAEVSMRDLIKNALRMRPDRIIVGEVRGPEAFDMMQAMNTGHEGSLTTLHANHPRDALSRLENMVNMADLNIPAKSMRFQIASALNIVMQISRMRDGLRRVTYVSEIVGMEGDIITMQDLFHYVIEGEDKEGNLMGNFKWTGIMPRFLRRVAYYGELDNLSRALNVKISAAK